MKSMQMGTRLRAPDRAMAALKPVYCLRFQDRSGLTADQIPKPGPRLDQAAAGLHHRHRMGPTVLAGISASTASARRLPARQTTPRLSCAAPPGREIPVY
jgi:hypothetical protein